MIKVGYGIPNPTHHISLSDGEHTIGLISVDAQGNADQLAIRRVPIQRTALKTTAGSLKYSDLQEPWSAQPQEDFLGRGYEDHEDDATKFFDSRRANLINGNVVLGPLETYHTGILDMNKHLPADEIDKGVTWVNMTDGEKKYIAYKFTASANYTTEKLYLYIKRTGIPAEDLNILLKSDNSGAPDSTLATATVDTDDIDDYESEFFKIEMAEALTSGTAYWIYIYTTTTDHNNCWNIGAYPGQGATYQSSDATSWTLCTDIDLYFLISEDLGEYTPKFFQFRRAKYLLLNPSSGAPLLYINGYRNLAKDNTGALSTLIDAGSPGWTTDEFADAIVMIISGTGYNEPQRWRKIVSNTADTLTITEAWTITHDATTEYVIVGSNVWKLVASHGMTGPVTSVMVANNICYFAQGESINIRRMQIASGAHSWADDGTNKATHLKAVFDTTDGITVWRANNTAVPSISSSLTKAWGTALAFGTAITFQDEYGAVTGLEEYGETNTLWILREGMVFYMTSDDVPAPISLREMFAMMEDNNGKAHLVHNVYLFFGLGSGLERYYNSILDDVGVNRNAGLPTDRQGVYSALLGYPAIVFGALDGGSTAISAIYASNSSDWWELYRGPAAGDRILALDFQPVPGLSTDRMLTMVGDHVISLNFPSMTIDPTKDTKYRYTHEASLTTGWIYGNMFDVDKIYHSIRTLCEDLYEGEQFIEVDIMFDDDAEWTRMYDVINTSPSQEIKIMEGTRIGRVGNRMRIRLRMQTDDSFVTMKLKTLVTESVVRVPVKYSYSVRYRAEDGDHDLNGNPDSYREALDKVNQIEEWAASLTPLTMRCNFGSMDDKTVFIDPPTSEGGANYLQRYINEINITEV